MVTKALYVVFEARQGREAEAETFLRDALPLVEAEPMTTAWFALRINQTTFGIFDAFPDELGRETHLMGKVAAALKERTDLFVGAPTLEPLDVFAAKLPGGSQTAGTAGRATTGT